MPTIKTIDPVTRLEGHLKIEVTIDTIGGVQKVVDARATGTLFRGFESLLINRDLRERKPGHLQYGNDGCKSKSAGKCFNRGLGESGL